MNTSYAADYSIWARNTANLVRENRWREIDLEHLAEELEDLSKSEKRGITSQLIRLLLHLLKWQYQPQRRSDSWLDSITDARTQIELTIEESPCLRSYLQEQLAQAYQRARRSAAQQTGLPLSTFPEFCRYCLTDILSEGWMP